MPRVSRVWLLLLAVCDALAVLLYVAWLVACSREGMLFSRMGVVELLPVLPIAFIAIWIVRKWK